MELPERAHDFPAGWNGSAQIILFCTSLGVQDNSNLQHMAQDRLGHLKGEI